MLLLTLLCNRRRRKIGKCNLPIESLTADLIYGEGNLKLPSDTKPRRVWMELTITVQGIRTLSKKGSYLYRKPQASWVNLARLEASRKL